ncbi:hypothetical protein B296_00054731 [Ensete ventricosum]|uniref:Uncharacterized protein n=1 Tax=Ensete ventricosum TaxID=4639 RepID=A0A426X7A1_ENSVE|nr:hypothetical protein B296_00054731 [Ensete ventricosum]
MGGCPYGRHRARRRCLCGRCPSVGWPRALPLCLAMGERCPLRANCRWSSLGREENRRGWPRLQPINHEPPKTLGVLS